MIEILSIHPSFPQRFRSDRETRENILPAHTHTHIHPAKNTLEWEGEKPTHIHYQRDSGSSEITEEARGKLSLHGAEFVEPSSCVAQTAEMLRSPDAVNR